MLHDGNHGGTPPKLPILDSNQDLRLQRPLRYRYANGQKNGRSAFAEPSSRSEAGSRTRLSRDVKCRVSVPFRPSTDTFTSSYREEGLNEPTHVYGLSNPEPAASSQRHQGESNALPCPEGFRPWHPMMAGHHCRPCNITRAETMAIVAPEGLEPSTGRL